MSIEIIGSLVVLALLDSTSIGTLFVPIVLMLVPGRLRGAPILGYLFAILGFYLVLGVLILLGAGALFDRFGEVLRSTPAYWVQLALAIGLFLFSFRFDPKRRAAKGKSPTANWTERVQAATESSGKLVALAFTAGLLEIATMFPYLGAIALVAGAGLPVAADTAILAGYCLVMILPALLLLLVRITLADRVTPMLTKANNWFEKHAVGATGWILAIIAFLLARDAVFQLGLFDQWLTN
ncbi:Sap-like sulfolipid-1-addressing protein [Tamaricihabitans halophyticus]|uniref:Sap-like sulfolipid-1-addressing protein n=1 Tax=Tamaricihabitans halophyticus TaxID=1262583 RepID=A0A4R2Q5W2_9PSEU|nr:GAP family protein [Tamaricihabitans halophyticus]TCP42075.1 Sap-like sulfolipid-1-addressing protein [Tamaricihabitans halophyticus]